MTDTEILDYIERTKYVPMPNYVPHISTTDGSRKYCMVCDGWTMPGYSDVYPTLRATVLSAAQSDLKRP